MGGLQSDNGKATTTSNTADWKEVDGKYKCEIRANEKGGRGIFGVGHGWTRMNADKGERS